MSQNGPVQRYPDEPDPKNEHEWKCWWVNKMFDPDKELTEGALKWTHQCWQQTAIEALTYGFK